MKIKNGSTTFLQFWMDFICSSSLMKGTGFFFFFFFGGGGGGGGVKNMFGLRRTKTTPEGKNILMNTRN